MLKIHHNLIFFYKNIANLRFIKRVRTLFHILHISLGLIWLPGAPAHKVRSDKTHGTTVRLLPLRLTLGPLSLEGDGTHRRNNCCRSRRHCQSWVSVIWNKRAVDSGLMKHCHKYHHVSCHSQHWWLRSVSTVQHCLLQSSWHWPIKTQH